MEQSQSQKPASCSRQASPGGSRPGKTSHTLHGPGDFQRGGAKGLYNRWSSGAPEGQFPSSRQVEVSAP